MQPMQPIVLGTKYQVPAYLMKPMQPMQPMQPMKPMQPMQPMQPMKPMKPMQPMIFFDSILKYIHGIYCYMPVWSLPFILKEYSRYLLLNE